MRKTHAPVCAAGAIHDAFAASLDTTLHIVVEPASSSSRKYLLTNTG